MKLPRRQFLHLAAGAAALPAVSRVAWAQAYPTRPVRIIVGFAAGGTGDIIARLMGQWLSERLGQPFIIENRPGGGTNIATEAVVRAPADGYTLLSVGSTQAINATLYNKLNFHFIRDITPVAGIVVGPNVMVVNPSVPATTVPEFIAYAKANAGKLSMASGGIGSASHNVRGTVQDDDRDQHRARALSRRCAGGNNVSISTPRGVSVPIVSQSASPLRGDSKMLADQVGAYRVVTATFIGPAIPSA